MISNAILDAADHAYRGSPPDPGTGPAARDHRAALRRALIVGLRNLYLDEAKRLREGPHSTLAVVVSAYCDGMAAELAITP